MANLDEQYRRWRAELTARGQEHILHWWAELDADDRAGLIADLETIPWPLVDELVQTHVLKRPQRTVPRDLAPAEVISALPVGADHESRYRSVIAGGRDMIAAGKVAAFTVAGGQGTRLGLDGPKGAVVVTPVGNRTLFEIFATTILTVRKRYGASIPWYVMTSRANHDQTVSFLSKHNYFGLPVEDVVLFSQGMLPAFDHNGKLLLEAKGRLALAPDGHGGSLQALVNRGALSDMRARGVEIVSYFQVDNPLVKPLDPLFIGLHVEAGSEMSVKVTPKADDLEKVGNVCVADGKLAVIEYSDLPESVAHERNTDGSRRLDAGNLAIHLLNVDFVDRIVGKSFQLPFRRAEKVVPFIDERGVEQLPTSPNAVKLETFVFDALPLANHPLVLQVSRAEEFSPVKNATGPDSLETSRRDQIARACRWLEVAGVSVPRKANADPDVVVTIAPSFALDAEEVKAKADLIPALTPVTQLYLE